jgi:hypothetical protein
MSVTWWSVPDLAGRARLYREQPGVLQWRRGDPRLPLDERDGLEHATYWNRQLPTSFGWRGDQSNQDSGDVIWVNNIGWANPALAPHNSALLEQWACKGVIWQNNISYEGAPGKASFDRHGKAPAGNLLGTDPMLVDPPSDFRLRPGSPAIGAGTSAAGVPGHDLTGNRRSGPVDIGADAAGATR